MYENCLHNHACSGAGLGCGARVPGPGDQEKLTWKMTELKVVIYTDLFTPTGAVIDGLV